MMAAEKYVIHFKKGDLPPVSGFWSLTMYDENFFFVDNPLNRYSISPRQDLTVQSRRLARSSHPDKSPGADREANWLPAPDGKFVLMMRLYWPNENDPSILDRTWTIPPVEEAG